MERGLFVISLDFELMWGMIEKSQDYSIQARVKKVKEVIPKMLQLFTDNEIHATWAIVGLLMMKDFSEAENYINKLSVKYDNDKYNVSKHFHAIMDKLEDASLYFANDLIKKIKGQKNQELACHSFSHYYANEKGQSIHDFENDINIFNSVLIEKHNLTAKTYISPRFQHNALYNKVLIKNGFNYYRGIREDKLKNKKVSIKIKNCLKYFDRYLNLLGHRSYNINEIQHDNLMNIKESYYLRPYNKKHKVLEWFKLRRIKKEMTFSAKKHKIFHLWWHPHDFGINLEQNLKSLEKLLKHYQYLKNKYDYKSLNMKEVYEYINNHE